ncbi:MAG TPA: PA14 domain-containing protein, partial [Flavisolibacter sp.]
VYFDNIELREVVATDVNVADSVKFVYNATANAASTPLALNYIDVKGMMYSGTASTSPYSSVILLAAGAAITPPPVTCSATGSILREQWDNLNGNDVKDIPQTTQPTSSSQLSLFETSSDIGDKFGARIRGYVCPPQTGNYTFFIAGDDATELWLSTSDDPAIKKKIGYNLNWTGLREWNKFSTQKSEPIFLEAGKKYYIEALHKEGNGGDHLSVAWQLPNGSMEAPIAGIRLSPFQMAPQLNQTISFAPLQSITLGDGTITLAASSSSWLPVSFSIVSGPATINGSVLTPTAAGLVVIKASQAGNSQFGQAIDVMQQLTILPAVQCAATGSVLREQWNGINGNDVAQIPLSILASSSGQLTQFEASQNVAENYGSRIRGYICAPQTGNYTFFIAGDDATELWLSSNESPTGKSRIAYNLSWTGFREWTKFGTQKSTTIYLEAGKKYYIEALHKEGSGGDHLSVAWQLPNGTFEAPIAGSRLSPWLNTTNEQCAATGFILREEWENIDGNDIAQIPQNSLSSSSSQITVFEGLTNAGNKYGSRIRGYICPPQTGNYTFFISGDDATELWLSANALISGRKKIAYNLSWTDFREWNKFSSQKSLPVYLEAGKKYYIEALHKEGNGGDHLSVAWQLPDGSMEAPISGNRLSPVLIDILSASKTMFSALDIGKELSVPVTNGNAQTLIAYPNPFNTKTTIEVNSPANGLVTIEVYDVSGRMIKKIFQREMTAKEKVRIDFSGSQLANGIYFLKLISPKGFEHFKLIKN